RAGLIYDRDPELGLRLLHDEDACPPELRDFTWGLYNRWCHRERATLKGHTGRVRSVVFSPDGKALAFGSEDRTIKLWDAVTGQERASLAGPPPPLGREEKPRLTYLDLQPKANMQLTDGGDNSLAA